LGGRDNIRCSSEVHWKARCGHPISDLVLIKLFLLSVIAEALRANIDRKSAFSLQRGQLDPKFQGEVVDPNNHSSFHKTSIFSLSCGIRMWAQIYFVL